MFCFLPFEPLLWEEVVASSKSGWSDVSSSVFGPGEQDEEDKEEVDEQVDDLRSVLR